MQLSISSSFSPTGDQPRAIDQVCLSLEQGVGAVTLQGVTGSGKTFTMANIIERMQRPALILSHNKTLAAQLYAEFKSFFPNNAVEYFVSYYDYYQPEAYLPVTDTYIEKDLSINDEIEKLRLSATSALLSGRRDVIVVCSVSCLYGIGNPQDFHESTVMVEVGQKRSRNQFLYELVDALYSRNDDDLQRGTFRMRGDNIDVFLAYGDKAVRIGFFGDEVESIEYIDPVTGASLESIDNISIYPANIFVTTKERTQQAISRIQDDMMLQYEWFRSIGKEHEANRLKKRVEYDIEMMREIGYCPGIENYSRYFDGREAGQRPFCLIDYFPKDFITFIDESHVTLPQVRAMYGGDRSRKDVLIEYGFRLPAAADNRPLKFDEFERIIGQRVYVSATPGEYELASCEGLVVEQVLRPTGLLDPPIDVRPSKNQIDDLLEEIEIRAAKDEKTLVTTLTKRMAEELEKFLTKKGVRSRYIHSDVDTLERVQIIEDFKAGLFDVLVGVNLLREGLDMPTVSLVAVIDADKEGFLRSDTALIQIAGRAARNLNGQVIFYADKITGSMQRTIDLTQRRRALQKAYKEEHGIVPTQVVNKSHSDLVAAKKCEVAEETLQESLYRPSRGRKGPAGDVPLDREMLALACQNAKAMMEASAARLDFVSAAKFRDEMFALQKMLDEK